MRIYNDKIRISIFIQDLIQNQHDPEPFIMIQTLEKKRQNANPFSIKGLGRSLVQLKGHIQYDF